MSHERAKALLERQWSEGPLAHDEDAELRAHLGACDACRALYDRSVELERVLSGRTTPRAQVDRLLARGAPIDGAGAHARDERAGPEQTPVIAARHVVPLRQRIAAWSAPLALAAGLVLAIATLARAPRRTDDVPDGLRTRGASGAGRRAWMSVFTRSKRSTEIVPLGDRIAQRDSLYFAYTSLAEGGHGFVAIAGLDAAGRAHWYHPEWRDAKDDPESLALVRGADVELPDEIVADAALGPLEICALFSDTPLRVRDVDAVLERDRRWPEVPVKDCVRVEVVE